MNGTNPTRREWVRHRSGTDGVELLEASFDQHVYERHIHETYAIGVTRRGVQRFWCRGATHDSLPAGVIVIPPGEAHDGESGAAGVYSYRMFYVPVERVRELAAEAFERPASSLRLRQTCLLHEPALARDLDVHGRRWTLGRPRWRRMNCWAACFRASTSGTIWRRSPR